MNLTPLIKPDPIDYDPIDYHWLTWPHWSISSSACCWGDNFLSSVLGLAAASSSSCSVFTRLLTKLFPNALPKASVATLLKFQLGSGILLLWRIPIKSFTHPKLNTNPNQHAATKEGPIASNEENTWDDIKRHKNYCCRRKFFSLDMAKIIIESWIHFISDGFFC